MCAGGGTGCGRSPAGAAAALAARDGRPVRPEELIELVWGDDAPSNGMKSLQVLVSRARNSCGADAIVRDGAGYRLGAAPDEVDSAGSRSSCGRPRPSSTGTRPPPKN